MVGSSLEAGLIFSLYCVWVPPLDGSFSRSQGLEVCFEVSRQRGRLFPLSKVFGVASRVVYNIHVCVELLARKLHLRYSCLLVFVAGIYVRSRERVMKSYMRYSCRSVVCCRSLCVLAMVLHCRALFEPPQDYIHRTTQADGR